MTIWDGDDWPPKPDAAELRKLDRVIHAPLRRARLAGADPEAVCERLWREGERQLTRREQATPTSPAD